MNGSLPMMKPHINIYKTFDVVVVPFPFVDSFASKNRPALVISSEKHYNIPTGHSILVMITSALHTPWPSDVLITNLKSCGLQKPSAIRLKFFTLDNRLIKTSIGKLSVKDITKTKEMMSGVFEDLFMHGH